MHATMTLEDARNLDSRMPQWDDVLALAIGGPVLLTLALVPAALLALCALGAATFETIRKGLNRFRSYLHNDSNDHNDAAPPLHVAFAPLVIDVTASDVQPADVAYVCEPGGEEWQQGANAIARYEDVVCDTTAANSPVDPPAARKRHKWEVVVGNVGTVYSGRGEKKARADYLDYCNVTVGRPADQHVALLRDGEVVEEKFPKPAPKQRRTRKVTV